MKKYVVDSSVDLKSVLPEVDSPKAVEFIEAGHTLIAPDIYTLEAAHVLSKRVRQHLITAEEAREALIALLDERPALKLSSKLLDSAFEISLRHHCSQWDATYIALAVREQVALVTADEKLVKNINRPDVLLLRDL